MSVEPIATVRDRARVHAALGDVTRLRIVDALGVGDASPAELASLVEIPSNLLAHHLKILESAGLVARRRSDGDARRTYLRLRAETLSALATEPWERPARVLFVCTANSARSQLAAAIWRDMSALPVASAGTRPAPKIAAGARTAARRHRLPLGAASPATVDSVLQSGDLVVSVCDHAHEELGGLDRLHWSVPDPVPSGTDAAYDDVIHDLAHRVHGLSARLN